MIKPKQFNVLTIIVRRFFHLPKPLLFIIAVIILGSITFSAVLYRNYAEDVKLTEYNQKVKECGKKDLVVYVIYPKGNAGYITPKDSDYSVPASGARNYFCTEQEAIDAGYKSLW